MALRKPKVEMSLRARTLRLLARREHSRLELQRKLAAYSEDSEEIAHILDDFEHRGWLSESRWVDQVMASRRRRFGTQRIAHELREKGVSDSELARARTRLEESELETARAVWLQKFGSPPGDARARARQMRFLQGRGFSPMVIRRVLTGAEE